MDTLALRREVEKCKIEIDRDLEKINKLRKFGRAEGECCEVMKHKKTLNDKMQKCLERLERAKVSQYNLC